MNATAYAVIIDEDQMELDRHQPRAGELTRYLQHKRHEETQSHPTPRLIKTEHRKFSGTGWIADFIYSNGTVMSYDGRQWYSGNILNRELMGL